MTYFSTGLIGNSISSCMPFLVASGIGFTFFGLTQETTRNFPMSWKRAIIYAIAIGCILFGLTTSTMLFFLEPTTMHATLGTLIPFVLPGLGVLVFLLLTEKKRYKPWVIEAQTVALERHAKAYSDPRREKRGLLSGALWVVAFAFFLLTDFVVGWKYAVLILLIAVAGEILIEFWMQTRQA